jgi:peptide chain release factor subunit 1
VVNCEDGKDKRIIIDFEPFKPVSRFIYWCDNKFHVDQLSSMLDEDDEKYGFIIIDGNGCLFATLQGNQKTVLYSFSVDLPKKHGRGGQSALRFARLRLEKRANYLRKCCEYAVSFFISSVTNKCSVAGIVLGGSADFKNEFAQSGVLDPRLAGSILSVVDTGYGMEAGLHQAIDLSKDGLSGVKLMQEKKLLQQFYEEIARDTGRVCYMVGDTMKAMTDYSAVETLLIWEDINYN